MDFVLVCRLPFQITCYHPTHARHSAVYESVLLVRALGRICSDMFGSRTGYVSCNLPYVRFASMYNVQLYKIRTSYMVMHHYYVVHVVHYDTSL